MMPGALPPFARTRGPKAELRNGDRNQAGLAAGAGLDRCDADIIEQNTIYGNTSDAGAGVFDCDAPVVIKNNIIWANTGGADPQIVNSTAPFESCIQNYSGSGSGIETEDPRLVTTRLVLDTVFETGFKGGTWPGNWSEDMGQWTTDEDASGDSYLTNLETSGTDDTVSHAQSEADRNFRFSYYLEEAAVYEHAVLALRVDTSASPTEYLELVIENDSMYVRERHGSTVVTNVELEDSDGDPVASASDTWYDMVAAVDGATIEVSRRLTGERYERLTPVSALSIGVLDTAKFQIIAEATSVWRFDDISWDRHNLDLFMNLSEGSKCIDTTEDKEDLHFRDFDDVNGPLDGDDDPQGEIVRDMGAHEYGDVEKGVYWWESITLQ